MKILFLTRRFYPEIGGVEKHVFEISKRLVERGHEVKVVTELPPKNQHNKKNDYQSIGQSDTYGINLRQPVKSIQTIHFEPGELEVLSLNFGKNDRFKKFRIWGTLFKNLNLIKEADIIHCHDVFFWYLPFRFLLPLKKVFTTFHGYETKFPPAQSAIFIRRLSNFLSMGSIAVGNYIEKWYGTKSNFVTYGGAEELKTKNSKLKSKNRNLKILFLGRIEEDNGVSAYIKLLRTLKEQHKVFDLVVCGDGSKRKEIEKYGLVLGFVSNAWGYVASSDLVRASSYLSMLEALVAGKSVFATYNNELKRDYLVDSPFRSFINIGQAEDFAVIIQNLDNEKAKKGQIWAKKQTWDRVVDTYLRLWRI